MRLLERAISTVVTPLVVLGLAGCSGDQVATYEPITDPAQLYMRLTLNHSAVTMAMAAPYNTLQLVGTPRDALGHPITGLPAPTFTSSDTTSLYVSPEGVLTARQPAAGILVIADLVASGNVRHVDTAVVNVTADPPPSPLATISIHPVAPDSAIWALPLAEDDVDTTGRYAYFAIYLSGPTLPWQLAPRLRALDAAENPMSDLNVEYLSLDPLIATVDRRSGFAQPLRTGRVRVVAQTTAYGVTKADTVVFAVTPPAMAIATIKARPGGVSVFGSTRRIRSNGIVFWVNALGQPVDIVYDNPTNVVAGPDVFCSMILGEPFFLEPAPYCSPGNLSMPQAAGATVDAIARTMRIQQFTVPGTYEFRDPQSGETGRIVVTDGADE